MYKYVSDTVTTQELFVVSFLLFPVLVSKSLTWVFDGEITWIHTT